MKEKISQLMDGELEAGDARRALDALHDEPQAQETWRRYHLISDAMRDTPLLSSGFAARLQEKLDQEPTVFAPGRIRVQANARLAMPAAAAAGVAAVALVGWLAFAPQQPGRALPQVAQAPAVQAVIQPVVSLKPPMVPLPSGTPDYLLAHQGFSPRVSLQGMAAYARTVSDQATEARK
jgi:sigma-E factor negative regulatory protein RseA